MSNDKEQHKEMIKKGAEQILSWAYELSQDYLESILEDVLPKDLADEEWWVLAHECRDLMGNAIIPEE